MLVLTRKLDESLQIGDDIKITVLRIKGNTIRIGIEAPRDVRVVRSELTVTSATPEGQAAPQLRTKVAQPDASQASVQQASVQQVDIQYVDVQLADEHATVTTIVDSPKASTPRLFVGKVSMNGGGVSLKESSDQQTDATSDAANVIAFDGHAGVVGSAPLRAFLQASRGLTAV